MKASSQQIETAPASPGRKAPTAAAAAKQPRAKAEGKPADADNAAEEDQVRERYGLAAFWHDSSSWILSALFHAIVLLVLALSWITLAQTETKRFLVTTIDGEEIDQLEESTLEDQLDDVELEQADAMPINVDDVTGMAALGDMTGIESEAVVDVGTINVSKTMGEIGALFGNDGRGWSTSGDGMGGAEFYGVRASGQKFVFIVDNSLSMNQGRFEAACIELFKSVAKMSHYQSFYVYFFSDTAYPLFHPQPATGWVKATPEAKMKLKSWLPSVDLVLKTNALGAVQQAIALKPDGIYILTDGAFTDRTHQFLMTLTPQKTGVRSIHTVGMELKKPEAERVLKSIANQHNGTYRLVHVDPRIRAAVGKGTRPRHSTWGPIWGTALGQQKGGGGGGKPKGPGAARPGGGARPKGGGKPKGGGGGAAKAQKKQ